MNPIAPQNAPATPAPPKASAPAKPQKLVLTDLNYDVAVALPVTEQDRLMKGFASRITGLKETRNEVKTESKYAAILLAALEIRVKRGIEANVYSSTFTVTDLYKQVTGEKPPGHVWTLKCSFVSYVLSGFIQESDFIGNRNICLDMAQKIVDACIEASPETGLQHPAVARAAKELQTRTETEAKVLRGILASVKPADPMTAEEALEAFTEICASGQLPVCLAVLPDNVNTLEGNAQRDAYVALVHAALKTDKALGTELVAQYTEHANAGTVKVVPNSARSEADGTPEETAPADYAGPADAAPVNAAAVAA